MLLHMHGLLVPQSALLGAVLVAAGYYLRVAVARWRRAGADSGPATQTPKPPASEQRNNDQPTNP